MSEATIEAGVEMPQRDGQHLLHNLRSAGIHSVDALYREALANPEVARRLISKMPSVPEGPVYDSSSVCSGAS